MRQMKMNGDKHLHLIRFCDYGIWTPDTATDEQPCPYRRTLALHLQYDDPSLTISLATVTVLRRTLLMAAGSGGRSTLTFLIASIV